MLKVDEAPLVVDIKTLWEIRRAKRIKIERMFSKFTGTIIIIGDMHGILAKMKLARDILIPMVQKISGDVVIVMNGDMMNMDRFARFDKIDSEIEKYSPVKEVRYIGKFMSDILKSKNVVAGVYNLSNHEYRLNKYLLKLIGDNVEELTGFGLDWKKDLREIDKLMLNDDCFIQIGDALFCHNQLTKPESAVDHYIIRTERKFNVLVAAHTHLQFENYRLGVKVLCCGSLCKTPDYAREHRIYQKTRELGRLGYAIVPMKNGKSDVANSHVCEIGKEEKI